MKTLENARNLESESKNTSKCKGLVSGAYILDSSILVNVS